MEKILKLIIGLLVLAILVVSYFVVSNLGFNKKDLSEETPNPKVTVTPSPTSQKPAAIQSNANIEQLLALNPGSGATTEQKRDFSAKISGFAVDTDTVDMTSCTPNPQISRVKLNKPIVFKNSDLTAHKVVNGKLEIELAPKSSKSITPAFPSLGIYGYTCDTRLAGIFLVVP